MALELHECLILLLSGKIKGVSPLRMAQQVQLYFSSARLKYCFVFLWFSVLTSINLELGFFCPRNHGLLVLGVWRPPYSVKRAWALAPSGCRTLSKLFLFIFLNMSNECKRPGPLVTLSEGRFYGYFKNILAAVWQLRKYKFMCKQLQSLDF